MVRKLSDLSKDNKNIFKTVIEILEPNKKTQSKNMKRNDEALSS